MTFARRVSAVLLCLILLLSMSVSAFAAPDKVYSLTVCLNNTEEVGKLPAYDYELEGNTFVSLLELSLLLKGTEKQFCFQRVTTEAGDYYTIETGREPVIPANYTPVQVITSVESMKTSILQDGKYRKYCSIPAGPDLFLNLTDVQLLLELSLTREGDRLAIFPGEGFVPDIEALRDQDFFSFTNGVVLGDLNTGRLLFSYGRIRSAPIASLTKLMNYLLVAEAADRGELNLEGTVKVSSTAAELSHNAATSTIWISEGTEVPVRELINAMFIASSNECALLLAEQVCGTEEKFVERMNSRARELGLRNTKFYNANGLPSYNGSGVSGKRQNTMSAMDVFTLCSYLIKNYPEITDITSTQLCRFDTLGETWNNSNHMLFNMDGVNGLKTGYTNRSGYCLAATLPVTVGKDTHTLAVVVLGTESLAERNRIAGLLLTYGRAYYEKNGF